VETIAINNNINKAGDNDAGELVPVSKSCSKHKQTEAEATSLRKL
jgi:hypothetical protein